MRAAGLVAVCCCATGSLDGRDAWGDDSLVDLRSEVRESDSLGSTPSSSPSRDSDDSCGSSGDALEDAGEQFLGELAFAGVVAVVSAPFYGPRLLIEDDSAEFGRFTPFPYSENNGYMEFDAQWTAETIWSGRYSTEYGDNFTGKEWIAGRLLVEHYGRLGLDGSVVYLLEDQPPSGHDQLWYGDANATFRFAQNKHLLMRAGLGTNWLSDEFGSDFGFNFTYGFDWFIGRPWVMSSELDLGSLNHAMLVHFRGTIGVQVNRFEAYTGYDLLQLDHSNVQGLVAGVRVWF